MELIGGAEQQLLAPRPAARAGSFAHAVDLLGSESRHTREPFVVAPLVVAVAVVRRAQDHQLGVFAREHAARHQRACKAQPTAKQTPVPRDRGEELGGLAARRDSGGSRNQRVQAPDLGSVARPDSLAPGRT